MVCMSRLLPWLIGSIMAVLMSIVWGTDACNRDERPATTCTR